MFSTKKEFTEFCKEISGQTSKKYTLVVFRDRSVARVTGPWEARKPVWCSFEGEFSPKEVFNALYEAYEDEDGVPCAPFPQV